MNECEGHVKDLLLSNRRSKISAYHFLLNDWSVIFALTVANHSAFILALYYSLNDCLIDSFFDRSIEQVIIGSSERSE